MGSTVNVFVFSSYYHNPASWINVTKYIWTLYLMDSFTKETYQMLKPKLNFL